MVIVVRGTRPRRWDQLQDCPARWRRWILVRQSCAHGEWRNMGSGTIALRVTKACYTADLEGAVSVLCSSVRLSVCAFATDCRKKFFSKPLTNRRLQCKGRCHFTKP